MFKFALLNVLLAFTSDDLLLKATNGVVSQNSAGVKILNEQVGGY
ncbi:hypothetical protein [Campylobacter gastrosuis]|uniref:Uncharacterized protein n=1 Tax=Campylobacter gastrosuis TaxID=2974576 RepID=A0ABT7HLS6_9BACT|nr:hypothetical protein [Campylobacter gastrosuis]MDL0087913.1 hypothetical protein [Campylobacter gastrosuis]